MKHNGHDRVKIVLQDADLSCDQN